MKARMDELNNQPSKESRVSSLLNQWEIDEINVKNLNKTSRFLQKCMVGKCPSPLKRGVKVVKLLAPRKPKQFVSSEHQDVSLAKIWVEKGRARRIKLLEDELREVRLQIAVASARTHVDEQEKNFKGIAHLITSMEEMDEQIAKAKSQIAHLKSQIVRVDQKKQDLSRETESEGEKRPFELALIALLSAKT